MFYRRYAAESLAYGAGNGRYMLALLAGFYYDYVNYKYKHHCTMTSHSAVTLHM